MHQVDWGEGKKGIVCSRNGTVLRERQVVVFTSRVRGGVQVTGDAGEEGATS